MRTSRVVSVMLLGAVAFVPAESSSARGAAAASVAQTLPIAFEPNLGQVDPRARFVAHAGSATWFFTDAGAVLALRAPSGDSRGAAATHIPWVPQWLSRAAVKPHEEASAAPTAAVALRYALAASSTHPLIEGLDASSAYSNYFLGHDAGHWQTNVPRYARVRYAGVAPGVEVIYYANRGAFEFDIELAPGADLAAVRLRIDGAAHLALDDHGDLHIETSFGDLVQRRPLVYQVIDGERRELAAMYALRATTPDMAPDIAFVVPDYDRRFALVVDPVLDFGTYFGGDQDDSISGVAVDGNGDIYIAGSTNSLAATFPETFGAYQTTKQSFYDAFVAKIKDDGSALIYATYIGGNGNDFGNAIAVDRLGQAVLGGETGSDTYPVVSAVQASRNGAGTTGIVTKLNAAGNGLVFSTYLGGNSVTEVFAIAADKAASTYVTGWSIFNSSFPTTAGAFQTTVSSPSGSDAFVVKYDSTGARVYATLLGAGSERADGIAVDGAGSAYVAGTINVAAIHGVTANVIGPGGGGDAMIVKFNPAGSALAYLTRIGGSSGEQAVALALDASNDAFFTGHSFSNDLPSAPAAPGNTNVALFGALDPSGTALTGPGLTWYGSAAAYNPSCPLGGAFGASIALDPNKPVAHIVGYGCPVSSFPVLDPVPGLSCSPTCNGDTNRLNSFFLRYAYTAPAAPAANGPQAVTGYLLTSSTPFAGASMTESLLSGGGIDNVGRVTLVGSTDGTPAATPNAIDASANGSNDGVVYRVRYETVPPFIKKEFSKATVNVGETVTLTFTIANKNPPESGISLTGISVSDALEDCMKVTTDLGPGFSFQTCGGSLTVTEYPSAITVKPALPGSALAAGQQCTFSVNVKATDPLSCPNATSRIQSDQGSGNLAEAVLDIEPAPQSIWSRAGGQGPGNTADAANWDGGISAPILGSKITFPPGTATSVNNNLPGDQGLNSVAITGNGFAIGGGTFNLTGGIENAATGSTLSAPIKLLQAASIDNSAGTLALGGGIDLAGDLYIFGAGATSIGAATTGTGTVHMTGSGAVTIGTAPTFIGSIQVLGGTLFGNAAIAQPIDADDGGTLRGSGPFSGAVYAGEFGRLFPGIDAAPANLAVGSLEIDRGVVELGFSSNNAQHSTLAVSGAVAISSGLLQLDFGTAPALSSTFSNLVTAPGTISGCFDETRATPSNVVAVAQCTANAVSATVKAVDRIFAGGFNY